MAESKWIIIELSELGESASHLELQNALTEMLGDDIEFFIPTYYERVGSYVSQNTIIEGYVFVMDGRDTRVKLANLHEYRYFRCVLGSGNKVHTVGSRVVGNIKRKLKKSLSKKLNIGVKVRILDGTFSGLEGEVIGLEDNGRRIIVHIHRPSRDMIVPVPSTSIEEINDIVSNS